MSNRQFIACVFRPGDTRSYTYHNDGDPVAVGDKVLVESPRDEGKMTIEVVKIVPEKPSFPTKPIIGKAPAAEEKKDDA